MKKNHRAGNIEQTKICPVCQLSFSNRKKWQQRGLWSDIVYCSQRCRTTPRKKF